MTDQKLARWIVGQWKRRGVVADPVDAIEWFERQSGATQDLIRQRMASGWQAPKR